MEKAPVLCRKSVYHAGQGIASPAADGMLPWENVLHFLDMPKEKSLTLPLRHGLC